MFSCVVFNSHVDTQILLCRTFTSFQRSFFDPTSVFAAFVSDNFLAGVCFWVRKPSVNSVLFTFEQPVTLKQKKGENKLSP